MRARGFTLLELLVGLAIGSIALVAAAQLSTIGVQSSGRGEQQTELVGRIRLVGGQLRADLSFAGLGSNGTIAVDPANWGAWVGMTAITTGNARVAIPVLRGLNNVGAIAIGGVNVQPGSDIIQIVVPDPDPARARRVQLPVDDGVAAAFPVGGTFPGQPGCAFVYAVDHAAPNGAGRSQLFRYDWGATDPLTVLDSLMFPLPIGTEMHCARISTYWVDTNARLHRSDFDPRVAPENIGGSGMWTTSSPNDVIAPGVVDLQLAYIFSRAGLPAAGPSPASTAITYGVPGSTVPDPPGVLLWNEVRSVRYTLVGRTLRQVVNTGDPTQVPRFEDRDDTLLIPNTFSTQSIAAGIDLTNLRYFDEQAEANVVAEPY